MQRWFADHQPTVVVLAAAKVGGIQANNSYPADFLRFELIRHDVTEPLRIEVDRIWHLACPASPVHYQFNPIKTQASGSAVAIGQHQ